MNIENNIISDLGNIIFPIVRETTKQTLNAKLDLNLSVMYEDILNKLAKSNFRSKFKLKDKDKLYIKQKGLNTIRSHACDFINKRIAPALIPNDGKQTPMKGHPVFIAQHATATCCRGCISKWHHFEKGAELNDKQREYIINLIMEWIKRQLL